LRTPWSQVTKTALPLPSLAIAGRPVRITTRDQDVLISVSAAMNTACVGNASLSYRWEQVSALPSGVEDFAGINLSSETVGQLLVYDQLL